MAQGDGGVWGTTIWKWRQQGERGSGLDSEE